MSISETVPFVKRFHGLDVVDLKAVLAPLFALFFGHSTVSASVVVPPFGLV